jgi:hypothetical protein
MSATPVDDLHFPISRPGAMLVVVVGKTFMFYAGCLLPRLLSERTLSFPGVRL